MPAMKEKTARNIFGNDSRFRNTGLWRIAPTMPREQVDLGHDGHLGGLVGHLGELAFSVTVCAARIASNPAKLPVRVRSVSAMSAAMHSVRSKSPSILKNPRPPPRSSRDPPPSFLRLLLPATVRA